MSGADEVPRTGKVSRGLLAAVEAARALTVSAREVMAVCRVVNLGVGPVGSEAEAEIGKQKIKI